jgi:hypothetical protein
MTGHVPEIAGHAAETVGHAGPKYPAFPLLGPAGLVVEPEIHHLFVSRTLVGTIMTFVAYVLSFLCLILNASLFVRLKPPISFIFAFLLHPQTVFRFARDIIERAGWKPGEDRIELSIDRSDKAIRARRVACGGYKLIGAAKSLPYVKFTAARGMPIAEKPAEATDVVVVGGELMFVLPESVRIAQG